MCILGSVLCPFSPSYTYTHEISIKDVFLFSFPVTASAVYECVDIYIYSEYPTICGYGRDRCVGESSKESLIDRTMMSAD